MKKKIFGGIAVVAIAAITLFNVNINQKHDTSLLALANVEALAECEQGAQQQSNNCIASTFCNATTTDDGKKEGRYCSGSLANNTCVITVCK
jgi:hypothetical protein